MNNTQSNQELIKLLSQYFTQRGAFLAQVIRADLQTMPLLLQSLGVNHSESMAPQQPAYSVLANPGVQGNGHNGNGHHGINHNGTGNNGNNGNNLTNGHTDYAAPLSVTVPLTTASVPTKAVTESIEPTPASPTPTQQPTQDVGAILIDLVVKQTGYPKESIALSARLLDDLNLDSIKGGELVANVTKECKVAGKVDPSTLANATLQEIVDAVKAVMAAEMPAPGQNIDSTATVAPTTAIAVTSTPATPTATTSMAAVSTATSTPWVRDFVVKYVPEAASPLSDNPEENWETANLFAVDNWAEANVLLIAELNEPEMAEALRQGMANQGARVQVVSLQEVIDRNLITRPEFTHIITVLPREIKSDLPEEQRLQRAMKRMRTAALLPAPAQAQRAYTSITYIQFSDGVFGRLPQTIDIEQGCTIGFAASLHLERNDLKVRVLDLPRNVAPDLLVDQVMTEMARPEAYLAVGYNPELVRLVPRPVVQDAAEYESREMIWLPSDVFLVTGGAKGITAECVLALAQSTGVRMALVGTSPHPQDAPEAKGSEEVARTLQRFHAEGLTCRYYQCDVTDSKAVAALVQRVQQELGPITGVIHGSALNKPRRVENSTLEEAHAELAPKVLGAINLCHALKDAPPKLFIGFSSISAVLGLPGNTWYGFSNEALDLILRRFGEAHPETKTLAIAFSVWSEVGMGARMGTVKNLNRMGIEAMPTEEGVRRFLQLVEKDPGTSQVVVTSKLGGVDTLRRGFDTWRTKRVPPTANLKYLEEIRVIEPFVEIGVRTHLSLEKDSYVKDHIYKGSYLFPTVFGLEAMAQVVAYSVGLEQFKGLRIEDIRLERPIVVNPEQGVDIEIRAEVQERESIDQPYVVKAEIRTEQTGFAVAHFAATFILEEMGKAPVLAIELPATPMDLNPKQDLYSWLLFQGVLFQRLQQAYSLSSKKFVFRTQREMTSEGSTQSTDRAVGPFILGDPYYRDSLLQSVQPIIPQDICLPVRIDRIQLYQLDRQTAGSCIGVAINEKREARQYRTSVVATDETGRVLDKLEGYQLRILEHREDHPTAEELANPSRRDEELLRQELNRRANLLQVKAPETSLAQMPGMHKLSAGERHEREVPLFSKAVEQALNARQEGV